MESHLDQRGVASSLDSIGRQTAELDARVRVRQIQLAYRNFPASTPLGVAAASLLVLAMRDHVPPSTLVTWFTLYLVFGAGSFTAFWLFYRRATDHDRRPAVWGRRCALAGLIHGLFWGSAAYFFFPAGSVGYQMVLFTAMTVPSALVMTSTVPYAPLFYASSPPMLMPLALRLLLEGGEFQYIQLAMLVAYLIGLFAFYSSMHKAFVNSIRLGFENLDLIAALTRQKNEAERANMAKTRFLAAASHDLRQPLHAQVLFLAELRARLRDRDELNVVEFLESSTNSLREMLNSMLDVSRLDAGVVVPAVRAFSLATLFDRLRSEFDPLMREKGLAFRVFDADHSTYSDPALLETILRNLLSNAMRYTHHGEVTLSARECNGKLCIEVRDSGVGIPTGQQESIFEEFYQLGNPERDREKGLGLGLSIVGRLVKLLGHSVRVMSEPDRGTCVAVDVPLRPMPVEVDATESVEPEHLPPLERSTVLVIDDDALVRKAMDGILKRWGCDTLIVASVDEALAEMSATGRRPTVIIADYRLRGGATGTEAIAGVEEYLGHSVPAILITGDTSPDRLRQALASGHPLLHKPIDPSRLYKLLQRQSAGRTAGRR